MSDLVTVTLILALFRFAMIFVGFGFAILGYRLFRAGVYEHASELKAAWGENKLVLKQAAPGTLFALFGVVVIATSIVRSISVESTTMGRKFAAGSSPPTKKESSPGAPEFKIHGLVGTDGKGFEQFFDAYEPLIASFSQEETESKAAIESMFLTTLGRLPTKKEREHIAGYLKTAAVKKTAYKDILWSLLSSAEYQLARRKALTTLMDRTVKP